MGMASGFGMQVLIYLWEVGLWQGIAWVYNRGIKRILPAKWRGGDYVPYLGQLEYTTDEAFEYLLHRHPNFIGRFRKDFLEEETFEKPLLAREEERGAEFERVYTEEQLKKMEEEASQTNDLQALREENARLAREMGQAVEEDDQFSASDLEESDHEELQFDSDEWEPFEIERQENDWNKDTMELWKVVAAEHKREEEEKRKKIEEEQAREKAEKAAEEAAAAEAKKQTEQTKTKSAEK